MNDFIFKDGAMNLHSVILVPGARGFEEIAWPRTARPANIGREDLRSGALGLPPVVAWPRFPDFLRPIRDQGPAMVAACVNAVSRGLRSVESPAMVWWRRQRIYHATCRSLRELDDHMLRDIGLSRDKVSAAAREHARRVATRAGTRELTAVNLADIRGLPWWLGST